MSVFTRKAVRRATVAVAVTGMTVAAVTGCASKKKTIEAELTAASGYIDSSTSLSMTFGVSDGKGTLKKLMTSGEDAITPALADSLLASSVTVTLDPSGDATFASLSKAASTPEYKNLPAADKVKQFNASIVVRSFDADLVQLRLVDGVLYGATDLNKIDQIARDNGTDGVPADLDQIDPVLGQLESDLRAGKWVRLPLASYLDTFEDMLGGLDTTEGELAQPDAEQVGKTVLEAIKPHVKVVDAEGKHSGRVLDVTVQAKSAMQAAITALQTLPVPLGELQEIDGAALAEQMSDTALTGQITLADSHFTGFSVDLEPLRTLVKDVSGEPLTGARLTLQVDDSAEPVTAPTDLSTVKLGDFIESFFGGLFGGGELSEEDMMFEEELDPAAGIDPTQLEPAQQ